MHENPRQKAIDERIEKDKKFLKLIKPHVPTVYFDRLSAEKEEEHKALQESHGLFFTQGKGGWFISGLVDGSRVILGFTKPNDYIVSIGGKQFKSRAVAENLARRYYLPVTYLEAATKN